jgi:hypothetical protein
MFGFVFALKSPTWRCKRNRPFHRIMLVKNMALDKHNESNSTCNKVAVRFLPDNVVVEAEIGKRLLDVAIQAGQLKEEPQEPFCRDGGCYKCEMETSNTQFEEYPLIRTCKYSVPPITEEIQLTKIDQVWSENML